MLVFLSILIKYKQKINPINLDSKKRISIKKAFEGKNEIIIIFSWNLDLEFVIFKALMVLLFSDSNLIRTLEINFLFKKIKGMLSNI